MSDMKELYPTSGSRQSFYGKAHELFNDDGSVTLQSYGTSIITVKNNMAYYHNPGSYYDYRYGTNPALSNTTMRHLHAFLDRHYAENLKDNFKPDDIRKLPDISEINREEIDKIELLNNGNTIETTTKNEVMELLKLSAEKYPEKDFSYEPKIDKNGQKIFVLFEIKNEKEMKKNKKKDIER